MRLKYRECVAQSMAMLLNHPNNKNKSCIRLKTFLEPRNMKHCGIKYMIKLENRYCIELIVRMYNMISYI